MDAKKIKLVATGILVILLAIIIFQNFEQTRVYILFAEIRMPLSLMLFLTFIIGTTVGWIVPKFRK